MKPVDEAAAATILAVAPRRAIARRRLPGLRVGGLAMHDLYVAPQYIPKSVWAATIEVLRRADQPFGKLLLSKVRNRHKRSAWWMLSRQRAADTPLKRVGCCAGRA